MSKASKDKKVNNSKKKPERGLASLKKKELYEVKYFGK